MEDYIVAHRGSVHIHNRHPVDLQLNIDKDLATKFKRKKTEISTKTLDLNNKENNKE